MTCNHVAQLFGVSRRQSRPAGGGPWIPARQDHVGDSGVPADALGAPTPVHQAIAEAPAPYSNSGRLSPRRAISTLIKMVKATIVSSEKG